MDATNSDNVKKFQFTCFFVVIGNIVEMSHKAIAMIFCKSFSSYNVQNRHLIITISSSPSYQYYRYLIPYKNIHFIVNYF